MLLALTLVGVAYWPVLFGGKTWADRDTLRFFQPSRELLVESLRGGRLPEWSTGVAFGNPFAGNPIHETFAPLGWLLVLLGTPFGFDLYELLHLALLAAGFVLVTLRLGASRDGALVAGVTSALCGYTTTMVPNGLLTELAWVPWVAWATCGLVQAGEGTWARARAFAWLVAALVCQLLSLEPATVLTSGGCGLLLGLALSESGRWRRQVARFFAAVASACLLAAVVLLPALALLPGSARGAGLEAGGLEWSFHPLRAVELAWPWFYGRPEHDAWLAGLLLRGTNQDPFWSFSYFFGLPVLVACFALRDRLQKRLLIGSLPFLFLALGGLTPLYEMTPLPRLVNFPEKFMVGAWTFWLIAAARGVNELLSSEQARSLAVRISGVCLAALGGGLVYQVLTRGSREQQIAELAAELGYLVNVSAALDAALHGGAIAFAALVIFTVGLRLRRGRAQQTLVLGSMLVPLMLTAAPTVNLAHRVIAKETPLLAELIEQRSAPEPPRVLRLEPFSPAGPFTSDDQVARAIIDSLETNVPSRFDMAALRGFEPAQSRASYLAVTRLFQQMHPIAYLALLSLDFVVLDDPERVTLPNTRVVGNDPDSGWSVLENTRRRPRAFVTGQWRRARDVDAALEALTAPGRVEQLGLVYLVDATDRGDSEFLVACDRTVERPERVVLRCQSPGEGYAVLLDEWSSGWSAEVDGQPAEILRADGLFRAVRLTAGQHEVVFQYRTPLLRTGASVSVLTLLFGGAWLANERRRGRRLSG